MFKFIYSLKFIQPTPRPPPQITSVWFSWAGRFGNQWSEILIKSLSRVEIFFIWVHFKFQPARWTSTCKVEDSGKGGEWSDLFVKGSEVFLAKEVLGRKQAPWSHSSLLSMIRQMWWKLKWRETPRDISSTKQLVNKHHLILWKEKLL